MSQVQEIRPEVFQLKGAITLDELKTYREWEALTPKQKLWVETFIGSNGDAKLATRNAFECASDRNSQFMSYYVPKQPRVRAALNAYFGKTPQELFLENLQKRIEDDDLSVAQVEGIKILCGLRGWTVPGNLRRINGYVPIAERAGKFKIGDICLQDGQKYRVTKVDVDGNALDGVEVE